MKVEFKDVGIGRRFSDGDNSLKISDVLYVDIKNMVIMREENINKLVTILDTCEHCRELKVYGEGFSVCEKNKISWYSANKNDLNFPTEVDKFSCSNFKPKEGDNDV